MGKILNNALWIAHRRSKLYTNDYFFDFGFLAWGGRGAPTSVLAVF
jgi:hypothetical protein